MGFFNISIIFHLELAEESFHAYFNKNGIFISQLADENLHLHKLEFWEGDYRQFVEEEFV